ncbi:amidohydrolase family protein [Bacillus sp. Marseille-P3661]|uniref:amidohydrolase family protein n=1 Tax=Bacillus sp. Marseille-P3661 TaxID=1936234 RepID=UPI000C85F32D|nr:amidohydrolase family protein [Bacillus sp. Marseille-P3661]
MTTQNSIGKEEFLANASREAERRGLYDFTIVDADCHHAETSCFPEIAKYVENPAIRRIMESNTHKAMNAFIPDMMGDRHVAGRLKRAVKESDNLYGIGSGSEALLAHLKHSMKAMAIDYSLLFPTPILALGMNPKVEVEAALAHAYDHWLVENILAVDKSVKALLYLPFNDPDMSLRIIEELGDKQGVVGFMTTSNRYTKIQENRQMKVYRALEERELVLGFHSNLNWRERIFEPLNSFLAAHALGFPVYNMVHMTNLVLNGIPERFPKLKFAFIEAGLSWLPFMMMRLDNEYMMRMSEAPLLKKKPSEYIKEFYFTTQPLEADNSYIQTIFEMVGTSQILYASDYPHWDFDLPSRVYDLPFLNEEQKRDILGRNAMKLFKI